MLFPYKYTLTDAGLFRFAANGKNAGGGDGRFSSNAGIAIAPILFVIALLSLIGVVMSTGGSNFHVASVSDRIAADVVAQANLVRNTINNCNLQYRMALSMGMSASSADGYPDTPAAGSSNCTPPEGQTTQYMVACLVCDPMGTALWGSSTGSSGIMLPMPTRGFYPWKYYNGGDSAGRCIWTAPMGTSPNSDEGVVAGLRRVAAKFSTAAAVTASDEAVYDPSSESQKFIVWITSPTTLPIPGESPCQP